MKYDLAKLMQDALQNNITKKANDEKHPLQIEFEVKHEIDLLEYIKRTYKYSDSEFEKDIVMLLKNLLMPNVELDQPLDVLTKYWSDENDNITISSVYIKLEELERAVDNKMDEGMFGYITKEFAIETIAVDEHSSSGIADDEDLAKYIEYFDDKPYSLNKDSDEESMKQAIHPELLEIFNFN